MLIRDFQPIVKYPVRDVVLSMVRDEPVSTSANRTVVINNIYHYRLTINCRKMENYYYAILLGRSQFFLGSRDPTGAR